MANSLFIALIDMTKLEIRRYGGGFIILLVPVTKSCFYLALQEPAPTVVN